MKFITCSLALLTTFIANASAAWNKVPPSLEGATAVADLVANAANNAEDFKGNKNCVSGNCTPGGTPCCQWPMSPTFNCINPSAWNPDVWKCLPYENPIGGPPPAPVDAELLEEDVSTPALRGSASSETSCTTGWCTGLQACCIPGFKCLETPGSGAAIMGCNTRYK